MKGGYHSLISETFQGISDQKLGYDSDQEEKLVFVWIKEKDSKKMQERERKEKGNWKIEFLNHFVVKNREDSHYTRFTTQWF
jgi:hypothetical protein